MHIHLPDGVLPNWLWISGFIILGILIFTATKKVKNDKLPLAASLSAMMLIAMSIPLGVPTHINLSIVAGILLGPWWSLLVSLVVNTFLASFGHGGITLIGINTLIVWMECVVGYYLFKKFFPAVKSKGKYHFLVGFSSTVIATSVSFLVFLAIVYISNINPVELLRHEHEHVMSERMDMKTFILIITPIAVFGNLVEAVATGAIISYIIKVKPKFLL